MDSLRISEEIQDIMQRYENEEDFKVCDKYPDGGTGPLFPRLERAALNQLTHGDAIYSRYAIWAITVCDSIIEAARIIKSDADSEEAHRLLVSAANSLSAFCEVQSLFDPDMKRS